MLSLILALSLSQWPQHRIFEQPNLRKLNGGVVEPTYLEFAPTSGAGLPVISHHNTALCDALAAEVPSWNAAVDGGAGNWCLGGDGLAVTGSQVTFATFGSPAVIDTPVCPSGLDCLAATGQPVKALQTASGQGSAASAAVASGTGAMTACWWGQVQNGAQKVLLSASNAFTAGGISWLIEHIAGGTGRLYTSDGTTIRSLDLGGPDYTGEPTLYCLSHDTGSAPTRGYLNGTAGTASASGSKQSVTVKPTLDGINGSTYLLGGTNTFGAFYVDQELSATQIAAISRRVLADIPKAVIRGGQSYVDMTYSRTGSRFCARADNTGSIVPANRPCISQGGYLSEAAGTNLLLRSQEFENAYWVKVGAAVVTANHAIAPDGTKTAERLVGGMYRGSLALAAASTASVYVKGTSGSGTICPYLYNGTPAQLDAVACAYNSTTWTRCSVPSTDTNNIEFGIAAGFTGGCTPTAGYDVLIWGAQVETGSVATSYIPTTSAAASRGADLGHLDMGSGQGPSTDSASMAATTSLPSSGKGYTTLLRLYITPGDLTAKGLQIYSPNTSGASFQCLAGPDTGVVAGTGVLSARSARAICWTDGQSVNFRWGSDTATPASISGSFLRQRYLDIGFGREETNVTPLGAVVSKVCLDPRPSRCR